jgi:hypothetical protein
MRNQPNKNSLFFGWLNPISTRTPIPGHYPSSPFIPPGICCTSLLIASQLDLVFISAFGPHY